MRSISGGSAWLAAKRNETPSTGTGGEAAKEDPEVGGGSPAQRSALPFCDPRAYGPEDLSIIEQGLRLMLAGGSAAAEPEVIAAGDG